jgi:hypothetical protein
MRVVLIGRVVKIEDPRLGDLQDGLKVFDGIFIPGDLDGGTGIHELDLAGVFAEGSRFALLTSPNFPHIFIGISAINARPGAAGPVGEDHACEPAVRPAKAFRNPMVGQDLEIILVGADGKMGCPLQGFLDIDPIRDINVSV